MKQDPIDNEIKAEDDYSFNDIWKKLSEMFLDGIDGTEKENCSGVDGKDGR